MKVTGKTNIHANRTDALLYGRNPELWRHDGILSIWPRSQDLFEQGDIVDVAIATNELQLPWTVRRIIGKKALESEARIESLRDDRIAITGGVSVVKFCLEINLADASLAGYTVADYALGIQPIGPLAPFGGALDRIEAPIRSEADDIIAQLANGIDSAAHAA